jgi:Flp pilus assembly CpaF family ATPase
MSARVVVVVGGKGGAGATTLTVDLARAAAKRKQRVAVVDGDLAARRSMAVVLNAVGALDAARASGNISMVPAEGLTVVEMTATIDGAFTITPADAELMTASVVDLHERVFVDAPQPYAAALRSMIVRGHVFVLVVEPSLLGVTGARAVQLELARFGLAPGQVVIISNAREGRTAVSKRDIEAALQCEVSVEIPPLSDRRYAKAIETALDVLVAREGDVPALSPSMNAPIGDRRSRGVRRLTVAPSEEADAPAERTIQARAAFRKASEARDHLKAEIHAALAERIDTVTVSRGVDDTTRLAELRTEVADVVSGLIAEHPGVGSAEDVAHLKQEIIDEALGLGPLEELLRDASITEIMVNGREKIFIEREGKLELTAKRFSSDRHVRLIIERIVAPLGRRIDESQPMVDARLPDGSRVNAIVEPLAIDGPSMTIRKFPERRMNANDLVRRGSITEPLVDFLRAAVEARLNILVSGGTGSGKTTLLNVLSSFLPETERIVTIEDAAELSLAQEHVVRLEARPANIQGAGEIRIRDLVRNSLRMRPDRIIVGECRGGEALDMLQAMNTGHDGSLTTVHANSPRDAISRLETLVLMAGFDLPVRAIREQIAGALDMIVQIGRMRDGTRKVVSISEVVGLEGDVVTMQEIAHFEQRGLDKESRVIGEFQFTGVQPMCLKRFEELGITYDIRQLSTLPTVANW